MKQAASSAADKPTCFHVFDRFCNMTEAELE